MARAYVPKRRCHARSSRTGEPCKKPALPGVTVCYIHGGASPAAKPKVELARARMTLAKAVEPIPEDDHEADPIVAFDVEHRRTLAWIRYFGEKIAALPNEHDLVWGMTKQEDIGAGEDTGVNTTYEAKLNIYYEAQTRERAHLLDLHKVYIAAKLDAKRLEAERDVMDRLELAITGLLTTLGHDPNDPDVRQAVRLSLLPAAS